MIERDALRQRQEGSMTNMEKMPLLRREGGEPLIGIHEPLIHL